ncbi:MAG: DUF6249 domain-containing protein [Betaproteobacteria bacterium]
MPAFFDPRSWRRRLVLGTALVAAIGAIAVTPNERAPLVVTPAFAQAPAKDAPAPKPKDAAVPGAPTVGSDAPAVVVAPAEPPAAPAAKRKGHGATIGVTVDDDDDKIHVTGPSGSEEFDSFAEFVHQAPWLAGLFFFATLLVFLVPLLVIVLIVWYKMRKTRMLNETMLKLAERGVVPPAEAMDAIGAARPQEAMAAGTTTASLYARAQGIRARSVWSDLRRGIILVAVGLAVQTCAMIQDGEASGIGLVMLFLGAGYVVLWYFEDRRDPAQARMQTTTDRGADRAP